MSEPHSVIPEENLPPGFARNVQDPPARPAVPRPAATIVLLRPGPRGGPEVLLLRRVRTAGFVPGAWVFPGGRVDRDDATSALIQRVDGLDSESAARRLDLPPDADPPAIAYYLAAVREAFEETGLLVGRTRSGVSPPSARSDAAVEGLRRELLADEDAFPSVLDRMGCRIAGSEVVYVAHWITPVVEPRRYDTRFFAALVPADREALVHAGEASGAVWITPEEALRRHREGEMPMVFPTVKTLEDFRGFTSPHGILEAFRERAVRPVLPRLVRTPEGVAIEVDGEGGDSHRSDTRSSPESRD